MYPRIFGNWSRIPWGFMERTVGTAVLNILHCILFSTTVSFSSVIVRDKVQTRTQLILTVIMLCT